MVRTSSILRSDVLIVDEDAAELLLIEGMLRSAGYMSLASTGDRFEVCALHRSRRFGLILLADPARIQCDVALPVLAIRRPLDRVAMLGQVRAALKAGLQRAEPPTAEQGFRLMVESIVDCAIVQLDADGQVLSWNRGAQKIQGWSAKEMLGRHFSRFYARADIETGAPQRDLARAAAGRFEAEGWRARKDGSRFWANMVLTAVHDAGGTLRGFASLTRDVTERRRSDASRKQNEERLESAALHDGLTGLANRQLLDDRAMLAIAHARRNKSGMAVVYLDLDGFKQVNDTLGHDVGDALLKMVGARLAAAVREADTVARVGGDEFALVLWHAGGADKVAAVASKVIKAVAPPYAIGKRLVRITISAGVAIYPTHGQDAATLLKSADLALHDAKHAGKNSFRLFDGEPTVSA